MLGRGGAPPQQEASPRKSASIRGKRPDYCYGPIGRLKARCRKTAIWSRGMLVVRQYCRLPGAGREGALQNPPTATVREGNSRRRGKESVEARIRSSRLAKEKGKEPMGWAKWRRSSVRR